MRTFEFLVFFVMIDNIRDCFLMIETSLIDSIFSEIRLYDMHFAEMSSTITVIAETRLLIMMHEVGARQFRSSFSEELVISQTLLAVVEAALCLS